MEDEPRGLSRDTLRQGMNRGRGEDWLAGQLTRRGHNAIQQYPVWRYDMDNQGGRYYIDIALGRVAVELYSYWLEPWASAKACER